jgi:hypothetical protein
MRARSWFYVAFAVVIVAATVALLVLLDGATPTPSGPADDPNADRRSSAASGAGGEHRESANDETRARSDRASEAEEPAPAPRAGRIDRARWNAIVEELRESRERAASTPAPPSGEEPRGTLDRRYIRDAVRAVTPLLEECYELARAEDPTLEGRLVVEFTIGGDPEVGGVVEESEVADDSALRHPILDECVRETMYTIELPPPEHGGRVDVRYPFVFAPDEDDRASETE